jgi:CubicO group peptidase (beta-lactamase class C family)
MRTIVIGRRRVQWAGSAAAVVAVAAMGVSGAGVPGAAISDRAAPAAAAVAAAPPATATAAHSSQAAAIAAIVRRAMRAGHLRGVIVRVTRGRQVVTTRAFGPSVTGQPATTAMHFRNGSVAFAYLGTLLMEYVDEHKVTLNETIGHWIPSLPESGKVTLKMLANQTTGYPDFETDPAWQKAFLNDPFQIFTYQERLAYAFRRPIQFAPGTNWSYAHTNFMILGRILSIIGKKPLAVLLRRKVLGPMGLTGTTSSRTAAIPSPVLHSFDSERRSLLHIPAGIPFYEESTFWNTVWGTPDGANETTTISDLTRTAAAVGTGTLLSRSSYRAMTGPHLIGFGQHQANCGISCFKQTRRYNFGLGVVRSGSWLLQDPLLSGYSAAEAYLPSAKIAIAVAVTFQPAAFNADGVEPNAADTLWRSIGTYLAPHDAPPSPPKPAEG